MQARGSIGREYKPTPAAARYRFFLPPTWSGRLGCLWTRAHKLLFIESAEEIVEDKLVGSRSRAQESIGVHVGEAAGQSQDRCAELPLLFAVAELDDDRR